MSFPTINAFAPVEIQAKGTTEKQKRFSVNAYNGGTLRVNGYELPIVVDLAGLEPDKSITANLDHDSTKRVGHIDQTSNNGKSLVLAGPVSGTGEAAREFTGNAESGYPWQASIEAVPMAKPELVQAGQTVSVNGQTFKGPVYISRKTKLMGVAFLSRGADDSTNVALTAQRKTEMETETNTHSNDLKAIKAAWGKATWHSEDGDKGPYHRAHEAMISAAAGTIAMDDFKTILAEEQERDQELQRIRTERPKGPAIHSSTQDAQGPVIEAALALTAGLPSPEKHYSEQVLEAAHKNYRGFGLQQALILAASQNGYTCRPGERINAGNMRDILQYAFPPIHASGITTLSLPGILSNVANKELLAGWTDEDMAWKEIAITKPVSDFKEATSYRLLDNSEYEELPKGGKITHGTLDEESYTRQAKTYAKMFGLDRVDIINDDLGAFEDLRMRLGRGSARKFNKIFWAAFMNNATFFTSGRGNYISGATTNLGLDGVGLELGVTAFRGLLDATGQRIGGKPELLLVPPELEFIARRLYQSTNVNTGGSSTEDVVPNANIHGGLYRPVISDWLSDSAYTGNSTTAWYLLRRPSIGSAVVVSFLNGRESPTVDTSEADFNQLGIQMRGYHDFGVDKAEYLAGIKSKGAA